MEQFYDVYWDRYIFPTDNDLFEHMNEILMFLEENVNFGLVRRKYDKKWWLCKIEIITSEV